MAHESLVDNMLNEMNQNNPEHVLSYNPNGGMGGQFAQSPVQPQHDVRMGEVQYVPQELNQAPTVQNDMAQNMAGERMVPPEMEEEMVMEAPDLATYGMEEEEGMIDGLLNQAKGPLLVAFLAFLISLPQVSGVVRTFVARFTTNSLYVNLVLAVLVGVAFYGVTKFLL